MNINLGFLCNCLFVPIMVFSQVNNEVFLFNLDISNDAIRLTKQVNISNNEGYDNQPSFYDDTTLLFSSTRNNQTDIATFNLKEKSTRWISNTPGGSEYSPLKISGKNAVSAIRLDTDGLQRLYEYDLISGKSKVLLVGLKVGYHVWYSKYILVSAVLVDDRMDLVVSNLKDHTNYTTQKNVGRSLHKIPGTNLISFISKEGGANTVKSFNPLSGATKELISLPDHSQDVCWLRNGTLVTAKDDVLLTYNPIKDNEWKLGFSFDDNAMNGITRLAISPNGNYLALVADEAPEKLIQKEKE